jgi:hypothetical protein
MDAALAVGSSAFRGSARPARPSRAGVQRIMRCVGSSIVTGGVASPRCGAASTPRRCGMQLFDSRNFPSSPRQRCGDLTPIGALGIFLGILGSFGKPDRREHPGDVVCAVLPTAHGILRLALPGGLRNAARDGAHPQTIGAVASSRRTDAVDSPDRARRSPTHPPPARFWLGGAGLLPMAGFSDNRYSHWNLYGDLLAVLPQYF